MELTEIKSERVGDSYFHGKHKFGLEVYIYPKSHSSSTYTIFGTKFGSINSKFKDAQTGEIEKVPDGIAHYLEHKLFENEDGDAFSKYAKTGASANAYTSFDITGYLFSCTKNFEECLGILLNFVQMPYFTEQSVQKEQGIISQEIRMYDDDPNWRVLFNLLEAMYHNHPVKVDIAGTVETIADITPDNLFKCYQNFYNLNNMVLCVAGNVQADEVCCILEKFIKPSTAMHSSALFPEEPYEIVKSRVEQKFDINVPMFQLGFKEKAKKGQVSLEKMVQSYILFEIFASKASPLYRELMDKKLINSSFAYDYFEGPGYAAMIFSGESKNPDEVAQIIKKAAKELHQNGINDEAFKRAQKVVYTNYIERLNSVSKIAKAMMENTFAGREDIFAAIEIAANIKVEDIKQRLQEQLDISNAALSVVVPKNAS